MLVYQRVHIFSFPAESTSQGASPEVPNQKAWPFCSGHLRDKQWSEVKKNLQEAFESQVTLREYGYGRYGSIPIDTIFSGMNIHLPAILMFTRGTRFWHTAIFSHDVPHLHGQTLALPLAWVEHPNRCLLNFLSRIDQNTRIAWAMMGLSWLCAGFINGVSKLAI